MNVVFMRYLTRPRPTFCCHIFNNAWDDCKSNECVEEHDRGDCSSWSPAVRSSHHWEVMLDVAKSVITIHPQFLHEALTSSPSVCTKHRQGRVARHGDAVTTASTRRDDANYTTKTLANSDSRSSTTSFFVRETKTAAGWQWLTTNQPTVSQLCWCGRRDAAAASAAAKFSVDSERRTSTTLEWFATVVSRHKLRRFLDYISQFIVDTTSPRVADLWTGINP